MVMILEKCFVRDTVENVIWHKNRGILQIVLRQKTEYETYRDTITITVKGTKAPVHHMVGDIDTSY